MVSTMALRNTTGRPGAKSSAAGVRPLYAGLGGVVMSYLRVRQWSF